MGEMELSAILAALAGVAICVAAILWVRNRKVEHMLAGLEHEALVQNEKMTELRLTQQSLTTELDSTKTRLEESKVAVVGLQQQVQERLAEIDRLRNEKFDAEKLAESAKTKWEEGIARLEQLKLEQHELDAQLKEQNARYQSLIEEHSSLKSSLEEREKAFAQQLSGFAEQKKQLTESFENLASRIFEEKGKTFSANSKDAMEQLLKPFREQITEFRTRVDGIHKENNEATGSLRKELEQLRELNRNMTQDARNLTEALKGDKKKVGSWGEIQLEKTLQQAGLVKGEHYDTQAQFKDAHGKNNFPDFIVKLPDDKHIVLDSKVSLIDYDAAIAAETEDDIAVSLDRHVQAVKNHIDGLAAKDYTNLIGMRSPSFVLMFMPIEPAYIEAMKRNKDLFNYGYQKNVVMVSHTTLMPILRTVANLWMIERSNSEARELGDKAGEVFNQVCMVAERLQKLGATLQTASKHYNNTVVSLVGQQGLHGKVERFNKLSSKVTKNMPELEPMHLDVETERLEVIRVEAESKATVDESQSYLAEAETRAKSLENEKEL